MTYSRAIAAALISSMLACGAAESEPTVADEDLSAAVTASAELVAGTSAPVALTIPRGTHSFLIEVAGDSANYYRIRSIKNPEGEELVPQNDTGRDRRGSSSKNATTVGPVSGRGAALVPNAPDVVVSSGEWTFRVEGQSTNGTPATGKVTLKVTPKGKQSSGKLAVRLHFTGASYGGKALTAAAAKKNQEFQDDVDVFRDRFQQVGITTTITYVDAPHAFAQPTDEGPHSLASMFQQESTGPKGLDFYFVDALPESIATANGIAGGLPGYTTKSGIALSQSNARIGTTMTHEAGHFLGLFHTQEIDGSYMDPLSDTRQDGTELANIMYPVNENGAAKFSEQQGWVMLNHPSIR
jgi:Pregnancy-associated plasma protein-A